MNNNKLEESTGNVISAENNGQADKYIEEYPGLNPAKQYASDLDEGEPGREPGN